MDKRFFPLFFTVFLDLLGLGIVIPIFAQLFLAQNGLLPVSYPLWVRTLLYGIFISSYPFAQFFGAPVLGALSDTYGRKKLLLLSLAGTVIGYILIGIAVTMQTLLLAYIGRLLDGFTGGNISLVMSSMADLSDKSNKAKNFGLIGMAFGLGFIMGPYVGGRLADPSVVRWFTFATPFWFTAFLCMINIILVIWSFQETLGARVSQQLPQRVFHSSIIFSSILHLKKAYALAELRNMFLVVFLFTFGFTFFTQFFQVFLIQRFSFDQTHIGELYAYMGVWIVLAQGGVMRITAKLWKPQQILVVAPLVLSFVLPVLLWPHVPYYLWLILPFVSLSHGLTHPNAVALVSNLASKDKQGEILGINQSIVSAAQAVPPLIAGVAVSININLPILFAGLSTLVGWIIFLLFVRV